MSDEKFHKLRSTLKGLPAVHAKKDFEQRLFQRVRLLDNETLAKQLSDKYAQKKAGWYINLFQPSFAPALGVAAAVVAAVVIILLVLSPTGDTPIGDSSNGQNNNQNQVTQQQSPSMQNSGSFLKHQDIAEMEKKSKEVQSLPDDKNFNKKGPEKISTDYESVTKPVYKKPEPTIDERMIEAPVPVDAKKTDQIIEEKNEIIIEKNVTGEKPDKGKTESKKKSDDNSDTRISKETFPFGKVSVMPKDSIKDTSKISRSKRSIETDEQK